MPEPRPSKFTRALMDAFLGHLSETLNVTASAKAAGISRSRAYEERKLSQTFDRQWHEAQCAAYDSLTAFLFAEARRPATGRIKDMTLKEKQLKTRLALALLTRHGPAVFGPTPKPGTRRLPRDPKSVMDRLEAKFKEMRARKADDE